jgi:hypothetical protein
MSNEPSRNLLYETAGEALYVGQVLEVNVRSLISILNIQASASIDADAIILSENKRTLGQLIEKLRPLAQFCSDTEIALSTALSARNYVAHEFFISHNDAFSNDDAMQEAVADLHAREREILVATAITSAFVKGFCQVFNIELSDVLIRQDI